MKTFRSIGNRSKVMATKRQYKKQVNKHTITWSEREKRYIIKNPKGKRIYDADTEKSAISWVERNA